MAVVRGERVPAAGIEHLHDSSLSSPPNALRLRYGQECLLTGYVVERMDTILRENLLVIRKPELERTFHRYRETFGS
jgi:hypothetical protein